jgi:TfoX/Sxy family transcriptional regulator of competence genes
VAYDPDLADRIRHTLAPVAEVTERKMFGGLAFLVRGHMTVVASRKGGMMIRADPAASRDLVDTTPARLAEMRGRQMQGWLYLDAADIESDDDLHRWTDLALAHAATLPLET